MAAIEPVRKDINRQNKIKEYSPSLRLWHWANTIVVSGSLITVLINSTVLDEHANAGFIKDELQKSGGSVTAEQTRNLAGTLSDKVWAVHIYFGYCLAALLLFRLILELFQLTDQKLIRKMKTAYKDCFIIKKKVKLARHEFVVKLTYVLFYLVLVIMAVTGLTLAFRDQLHFSRSFMGAVRNIHGFCMYLVIAFIIVHIAGVFMAEQDDSPGIVSDMINGGGDVGRKS
ncbi:MAG TPA: cytochrome b/b6 domain-containing protein [Mucilaginibacter sp.]|jgi:Ni/Fe-hydrogenase 1 B-type cytochrome subunit|nr:cytochrome b/b6 domain-containing protein [Mucilaginibacter sp.]